MQFSDTAAYVLRFINQTNRSLFLTGRAGTGKTTLLKELIRSTHKNTVVVAPTGIAALNAGGVTIHSLFQLPFAAFVPDDNYVQDFQGGVRFENRSTLKRHFRMSGQKLSVIKNMQLLVIDEVSMLRADVLDAMDLMLRTVRKNRNVFGGVQVLFIGDLMQLPPVIKNEEWQVLSKYYTGKYFFNSHAVQHNMPLYIELTKIYRQTDKEFITTLNNLRDNKISSSDLNLLGKFVNPSFDASNAPGFITLTTHNAKADAINSKAIAALNGREYFFDAEITDEFPDKIFPVEQNLRLKEGAQVMFVKNDPSPDKNYYNGKTGIISSISSEEIFIRFPEDGKIIEAERYEWKNIRYAVNPATKEIEEEVVGTFVQYPLRLAWAITVHKSQGLTFDKAILDVSDVFLPGQAYVALSRLRSPEGLILLSPLKMNGLSSDKDVATFAETRTSDNQLERELLSETRRFVLKSLVDSFQWPDLEQEWRNVIYPSDKSKTRTSAHRQWLKNHFESIEKISSHTAAFCAQLERTFAVETLDFAYISQRLAAAHGFFFSVIDEVHTNLLVKLTELLKAKKSKAIATEVSALEEAHREVALKLLKAQRLWQVFLNGIEISREQLSTNEIRNYQSQKVKQLYGVDENQITSKKKEKKRADKKSTFEETLELWKQNLSIEAIASARRLTQATIYRHFSKLIEENRLKIEEIMAEEQIAALNEAFREFDGESVAGLKEQYGDAFTWEELRLYKAHFSKAS